MAASMTTATPTQELLTIEKLREQELEEARIIQDAMLPAQPNSNPIELRCPQ